ncbi:hypothetical protein NKL07_22100 [Mesorhizobium sp. C280B]|uniref:hypothetical protein n=1 Tax=unclassified Mesorhizobium TaxID=325217 RepID=UPI0003CE6AB5|nr:hypothetical protein [Mesorhizobium sp. LSJC280B00]ESW92680.1 hypothetical protein X772_03200 [Mesorhizobium sp. LSJC280B00]
MGTFKHGHTMRLPGGGRVQSPEYRAYTAMKNRCLNHRQDRFKDYAGRGISICKRWLDADGVRSGFECFLADMGPKPSARHSLDREENDGNYDPGNCRWATRSQQARNTRRNRTVNVCGLFFSLPDAVDYFRYAPMTTVRRRIDLGWPDEDAVLTPVGAKPTPKMEVCF